MPGSRAEENGGIRPGDRILEVNGKDLRDSTVDDAAAFMMVGDVIIMSRVGFTYDLVQAFFLVLKFVRLCNIIARGVSVCPQGSL